MEVGGSPVELWSMALGLLNVSELYPCLTVSTHYAGRFPHSQTKRLANNSFVPRRTRRGGRRDVGGNLRYSLCLKEFPPGAKRIDSVIIFSKRINSPNFFNAIRYLEVGRQLLL